MLSVLDKYSQFYTKIISMPEIITLEDKLNTFKVTNFDQPTHNLVHLKISIASTLNYA